MKVYLDDEKTHVDPCPHNGTSGLDSNDRDHCVTLVSCISIMRANNQEKNSFRLSKRWRRVGQGRATGMDGTLRH